MSSFQAVNTSLAPEPYGRTGEETTPTTPRPNTAPNIQPQPLTRADDATTPTRATFGALASQRPLPASPFPATLSVPETADTEKKTLARGDSQYSAKSRELEDVDMEESDEGEEGSEDGSVNADGTRSAKKKKSQRFWCTDYPPCNLSFTRSEHLARHIRKHTGERPFQCHCSRRFSRLDNLRQHAQTVHVNEEIPTDSLAATGTRFQRQIRTDRVRPSGSRSRASTAGSQSSQGRGHHRNSLSTSSIGSIGSAYSPREDIRRRPPPLLMSNDPRTRLSFENHSIAPDSPSQHQAYRPQSPSGFGTPTSATFSTGQNSPRWGSGIQSPISSHSRNSSIYSGHRTPGRRLSVPSGANPFHSPLKTSYGPPPLTPLNSSSQSLLSPANSILASPAGTSISGSSWSRRESLSSATDDALRRRTWHPETDSNFTSRLVSVSTPNYYQSSAATSSSQPMRLPGIESFDPLPRPSTPIRRAPSPMMIDAPRGPATHFEQSSKPEDVKGYQHWDVGVGLHRNLTRLDITHGAAPVDAAGAWASDANRAVQAQAEQTRAQPAVRFEQQAYAARPEPVNASQRHQHHISAPPLTPREQKRHGWYHGPVIVQQDIRRQRTSPEGSSSSEGGVPGTPSSTSVADYNPSIVHSSGWVEQSQRPAQPNLLPNHNMNYTYGPPIGSYTYGSDTHSIPPKPIHEEPKPDSMLRLEALVAVATSEENATAAY